MELTGIRKTVFLDRYALKDETGKPVEETPEQNVAPCLPCNCSD